MSDHYPTAAAALHALVGGTQQHVAGRAGEARTRWGDYVRGDVSPSESRVLGWCRRLDAVLTCTADGWSAEQGPFTALGMAIEFIDQMGDEDKSQFRAWANGDGLFDDDGIPVRTWAELDRDNREGFGELLAVGLANYDQDEDSIDIDDVLEAMKAELA